MKLSTSSDGSGLVWLPPFHSVVSVKVNGVVTTTGFTVLDDGIQFSPIPPVGYPLEVTLNENVQMGSFENEATKTTNIAYTKRVDTASATVSYIGEAQAGSSESDPVWRIQKSISNPEGDINIFFAYGSSKFNQVWADRASLSYS
jgi:hypothetical protein